MAAVVASGYGASMVKIGTIALHVTDPERAAGFWAEALGYARHPDAIDVLVPPHGTGPHLGLYGDCTHLDLNTADRAEQQAEVERLLALGAERVTEWPYPPDADFVVLRDPDGNLFCVLDH